MDNIRLKEDGLDRGKYMLKILKVIAEYAPDRYYDIGEMFVPLPSNSDGDKQKEELPRTKESKANATKKNQQSVQEQKENAPQYESKHKHLDNEAFIMGISGSWGSGKTTFVKSLKEVLQGKGYEQDTDQNVKDFLAKIQFPEKNIIYFDAWKNDFYDDPFEPISRQIVNQLYAPDDPAKEEMNEALHAYWKELKSFASDAANLAVEGFLEAKPTIKGFGIIKRFFSFLKKLLQRKPEEPAKKKLKDKITIEDRIDEVQTLLSKAIGKLEKRRKLIVIIDELDRCKPTFAIKLLEIVKHLFNVKGIVFIFSMDIDQLSECIKTVYGRGFDSIGYLQRFFDYTSILPRGNKAKLFEQFARKYDLIQPSETADKYYGICQSLQLTPRQMQAVCSAFHFMKKDELKDSTETGIMTYFYLTVLKYRYLDLIQKITDDEEENQEVIDLVIDHWPRILKDESNSWERIRSNPKIRELAEDPWWSRVLAKEEMQGEAKEEHLLAYLYEKIELADMTVKDSKLPVQQEIERFRIIRFGRYPQGENGEAEPIEWIVLEKNENQALLISKYALDRVPYHEKYEDVTWETCTLRKWLNEEFILHAFTEEERKSIQVSEVKAERNPRYRTNPGSDTKDKVFLLNVQEAERYFENNQERQCMPTRYAEVHGVDVSDKKTCWWWLRSPSITPSRAADVVIDGSLGRGGIGVDGDDVAVRPACRINL